MHFCACADDFVLSKPEFVVDVKSDYVVFCSQFAFNKSKSCYFVATLNS